MLSLYKSEYLCSLRSKYICEISSEIIKYRKISSHYLPLASLVIQQLKLLLNFQTVEKTVISFQTRSGNMDTQPLCCVFSILIISKQILTL